MVLTARAGVKPESNQGLDGTCWRRDGLSAERMTYGDVAFDSECEDCQHRRGGHELGQERLEQTVRLTEAPRIRFPDGVQLGRQTCAHQYTTSLSSVH